jgi:hypothetical protein
MDDAPPFISGLKLRAAAWRPGPARPNAAGGDGFDADSAGSALAMVQRLLPAVRRSGREPFVGGRYRDHHLKVGVHVTIKIEEEREGRIRFAVIDGRSQESTRTVLHGLVDATWRVPTRSDYLTILLMVSAALKGALEAHRGEAAVTRMRAAAVRRVVAHDFAEVEIVSATPWSAGRASDMMIDESSPPDMIGCVGPCRAPRVTEVNVVGTVGGPCVTMRPVAVTVARDGLDPMEVLRALGPR